MLLVILLHQAAQFCFDYVGVNNGQLIRRCVTVVHCEGVFFLEIRPVGSHSTQVIWSELSFCFSSVASVFLVLCSLKSMDQLMRTVMEVLQELRIDLQDFAWLIAQQLRIDNALIQASDQVYCVS